MNERVMRAGAIGRVDLAHEPDFVLGRIEVHPALREIAGDGWQETIDPRVMQVLVALARAGGKVVSRDDLVESCWGGVIVGEEAINRCISRLRKAAETSGNAFSVETVPRVGYRLKTPGVAVDAPQAREPVAAEPDPAATAAEHLRPPVQAGGAASTRWAAVAVALLSVAAAAFGLWQLWLRPTEIPASPVAPAGSVAVLPFANMSGDPAKEYFSDGFSEELLNDLSNDPRLRVAARTSAFAFKGKSEDVRNIARALGVRAVVEGSVREAGNRLRVAVQLIDARDGYQIWSQTYDRDLADILSVQDGVARAVAAVLTHRLVPGAPAALRHKIDPEAYRLYLQARQQLNQHWRGGYGKAVVLFTRVTARQPDFADGFAGLARAALNLSEFDAAHSNSDIAAANTAAQKALSLNPRNIEAREIRVGLELYAWDWTAATDDVRTLRSQSPNNIRVLVGLRAYYNQLGFPDKAIAVAQLARSLDPLSDEPKLATMGNLLYAARYGEALRVAHAVLARNPDHPRALYTMCAAYSMTGQTGPARRIAGRLDHLGSVGGLRPEIEACQFEVDVASGNVESARKIVQGWEAEFPDRFVFAREIADAFVQLRDFDKASAWYEHAYERREPQFFQAVYWPLGADYRTTAGWKILTQRPQFSEWRVAHDKLAAELAGHRGVTD